jgi:uncharacterized protein YecE (DUF72 family)
VGTAGWSYADWEGPVYPAGAGRGFDRLAAMAALFDVLEINTTFYRLPARKQVVEWARRVASRPRFRFTVKAPRVLTHEEVGAESDLGSRCAELTERLAPLVDSGRLAALLLQFPYRFRAGPGGWDRIERLAALLREYPLVAEFRRAEWARGGGIERLRRLGVAFCNIDQPAIQGNLVPTEIFTRDPAYVRLHGRNAAAWFRKDAGRDARYDYLYSQEELREWAERAHALGAAGASEIVVIANNHYRGKAVCNALELRRLLEDPGAQAPAPLAAAFPRLGPPPAPTQRQLF